MRLYDSSKKGDSTGRSAPPMEKSALGSFSKVLVSLLIAALMLGCFAGAAAGANWGNQDSGPKLTLTVMDMNNDDVPIFEISNAYVSNNTGPDCLYLSNGNIASFKNVSKNYRAFLKGYSYLDSQDDWYYLTSNSKSWLFDGSGFLKSDEYSEEYIVNYAWNYSAQSDLTLYAEFYPNCTYINLSANGGSFPKPDNYEYEWDYGLLSCAGINTGDSVILVEWGYVDPVRDGYKFVGWALDSDGTNLVAGAGSKMVGSESEYLLPLMYSGASNKYFEINPVADGEHTWIALEDYGEVTLYAKWEKIEESSGSSSAIILIGSKSSGGNGPHIEHKYVTFDANGGNGEMAKQQFTGGQTKALSLNQFTREGFNFAGWALEPAGMVTFADGEEIMVDEDITIYAVWVEPIPDTPAVPADDSETGIPIWAAVLGGAVILAIIIGLIVYFFVIRRGGA